MASESECLGSTGSGPDVAQSQELTHELLNLLHHLLCLLHFEKLEQYEIDQLDLGTAWSRSELLLHQRRRCQA